MVSQNYKVAIIVTLAGLYAMQSIATTYSKDESGKYAYNANVAVMSTEFLKVLIAAALLKKESDGTEQRPKTTFDAATVLRFAVPALLYMCGNNLVYAALKHLDAPTFQVMGNLKIVVVAVVQRIALRSQKMMVQWLGVVALMLGMLIIGVGKASENGPKDASPSIEGEPGDLYLGAIFMLCVAMASALAGVYTEFLLKSLDLSVNFQNILLYTWGIVFCLVANASGAVDQGTVDGGLFAGFDHRTWMVVIINSCLGQVVSRVMKYADNVTKIFSASAGVIITMVVSVYLFDFPVTMLFSLGTAIVVLACTLFFLPPDWLLHMV